MYNTSMSDVLRYYEFPTGQRLEITLGDLTLEPVDAIVNAANAHLRHGGGIAGAIVRQGGREIQQESDAWVRQHGPVPHDRPAFTTSGRLPSRYVIHAVGPIWGEGDEDTKLAAAVNGALRCASDLGLESLALPAISTGIFGFPKERAAGIIFKAINHYFGQNSTSITLTRVVLYDQATVDAFLSVWDRR